ncbi:MAG: hypothetical protein KOO63_05705 [Bacteroidales bacterium]|nr:hypothetical protein [Candidatus Latescibacterota bacterium]
MSTNRNKTLDKLARIRSLLLLVLASGDSGITTDEAYRLQDCRDTIARIIGS